MTLHEALARRVAEARYPGAAALFWTGSLARGTGSRSSDIDLVVVFDRLDHAWRESFLEEGRLFEVFVHDLDSLDLFFEKDAARGLPVLMDMVTRSVVLRAGPVADAARGLAERRLAEGPRPWSAAELERSRFIAGDLLEDLRGATDPDEIRIIGALLYPHTLDHLRRSRGLWSGRGKHALRLLREEESEIGPALIAAFEALFARAEPGAVVETVDRIYAPCGGPLVEWRNDAPPHRAS